MDSAPRHIADSDAARHVERLDAAREKIAGSIGARTSGIVTAAISIGVLTLTIVAAWTTVGPAA